MTYKIQSDILRTRREGNKITEIKLPQLKPISLNIDSEMLSDLDILSEETGVPRAKIINSVLEFYLYESDLILIFGNKKIKVNEILSKAKKG